MDLPTPLPAQLCTMLAVPTKRVTLIDRKQSAVFVVSPSHSFTFKWAVAAHPYPECGRHDGR